MITRFSTCSAPLPELLAPLLLLARTTRALRRCARGLASCWRVDGALLARGWRCVKGWCTARGACWPAALATGTQQAEMAAMVSFRDVRCLERLSRLPKC
jgi:hypothetical protein